MKTPWLIRSFDYRSKVTKKRDRREARELERQREAARARHAGRPPEASTADAAALDARRRAAFAAPTPVGFRRVFTAGGVSRLERLPDGLAGDRR